MSAALAALAAVGPPVTAADPLAVFPRGYPAFYQDSNALKLELCLDGDGVNGPCIFAPVDPAFNPWSASTGFGAEAFYSYAQADTRPLVTGGRALLVVGLEAAYGGTGDPIEGNQMAFARVRVRFDAPAAAAYTIIHPYGKIVISQAEAAASLAVTGDIRVTQDVGFFDPANPAAAFSGALGGWGAATPTLIPFLTWKPVAGDPPLTVPIIDPVTGLQTGVNTYIGDSVTPHPINPGPNGDIFAIQQNGVTVSQTNLWIIAGKVHVPPAAYLPYTYTPPAKNLWDLGPRSSVAPVSTVGPVNRAANWPAANSRLPTPGAAAAPGFPAIPSGAGYPIGYPFWYQEAVPVLDPVTGQPVLDAVTGLPVKTGGLQLTACPGADPNCISMPVDPLDPASVALNVGAESFFHSADANLSYRSADGRNRVDANLVLALEGTFGNAAGAVVDGDQVVFGRIRLRAKVTNPGTYTFTHPYGKLTFDVTDPTQLINYTEDIGTITPGSPAADAALAGALYSKINPFLRWTTFNPDLTLTDPLLKVVVPGQPPLAYVGNPLFRQTVVGSPFGTNYFEVVEPTQIPPGSPTAKETLFTVTGKLFDALAPFGLPTPIAVGDTATTPANVPVTINVLANDVIPPGQTVTVTIATNGVSGTAAVNTLDNTVTYTPGATAVPGTDSFTYTITAAPAGTTSTGTVSITLTAPAPTAPVAVDDAATTPADVAVTIPVLANDTIPLGQTPTVTIATNGGSGTASVNVLDNTVAYAPAPGAVPGTDSFTYTVTTAAGASTATVTVTLAVATVTPPTAVADTATTPANRPTTIAVLANDTIPLGQTATVTVTAPTSGTATVNPLDNTVIYTPNPGAVAGPDSFNYTVTTAAGASTAAVSITLTAPFPVAVADTATTQTDLAVAINVLANDQNVAGAVVTIGIVNPTTGLTAPTGAAAKGTLAVTAGKVTYTPNPGATAGLDSFAYVVTVDGNASNPATVSVNLIAAETIRVTKGQLDLRKREWLLEGTCNAGSTLTIYAGNLDATGAPVGPLVGSVRADATGRWKFRAVTPTVPAGVSTIGIRSSTGSALISAPIVVR
jgi:hypothetical protein